MAQPHQAAAQSIPAVLQPVHAAHLAADVQPDLRHPLRQGSGGTRWDIAAVRHVAVMLPGICIMTAIQSASQSGFGMVADIDSGFMDKFFVAPMSRTSVLIGKLVADGTRMAIQASIILLIAYTMTLVLGWRIPFATGIPVRPSSSCSRLVSASRSRAFRTPSRCAPRTPKRRCSSASRWCFHCSFCRPR